jgi:hypothetical protein
VLLVLFQNVLQKNVAFGLSSTQPLPTKRVIILKLSSKCHAWNARLDVHSVMGTQVGMGIRKVSQAGTQKIIEDHQKA